MSKALEAATLAAWKAREAGFDARVARPAPDNIDMASGAYAAMQGQVKAAILAYFDAAGQDEETINALADHISTTPTPRGFDNMLRQVFTGLKGTFG
jgi:hypothetical protein